MSADISSSVDSNWQKTGIFSWGLGLQLHSFALDNHLDAKEVVSQREGELLNASLSPDGLSLALVYASHDTPPCVLNLSTNQKKQVALSRPKTSVRCCTFCYRKTNRYLFLGEEGLRVTAWDVEASCVKRLYTGLPSEPVKLAMNFEDTQIAVGCGGGQIAIYDIVSGALAPFLVIPGSQGVNDVKFGGRSCQSLLGSTYDYGHVAIWDAATSKLRHQFSGIHVAPAMGLAFSPINDILMASVGLDRKLALLDPSSAKEVKAVTLDSPLTCVDFHRNGFILGVGNQDGEVIVFDLRNLRTPVAKGAALSSADPPEPLNGISFFQARSQVSSPTRSSKSPIRSSKKRKGSVTATNDAEPHVYAQPQTLSSSHSNPVPDSFFSSAPSISPTSIPHAGRTREGPIGANLQGSERADTSAEDEETDSKGNPVAQGFVDQFVQQCVVDQLVPYLEDSFLSLRGDLAKWMLQDKDELKREIDHLRAEVRSLREQLSCE